MPTIPELFSPRKPVPTEAELAERFVLELGWGECMAAHWAAHCTGITTTAGWTWEEIERVCFLRVTRRRWL